MDFKKIKEEALKLKQKAIIQKNKAIDYSANKLSKSNNTINNKEDLDSIIKKSITTKYKNKETGVEKEYKHKSLVIFVDEDSNFFKDALYILPVIITKAFTQNIQVKLAISKIKGVKLSDYQVKAKNLPCLVVFEEEKVLKTIEGTQNILKLVKSFNLDINKLIEEA